MIRNLCLLLMIVGCTKTKPPTEPVKEKMWMVTTVAGSGPSSFVNGPALTATFHFPEDVVVGSDGIYVTDVLNFCVRKIAQEQVSTFAGGSGSDIVNGNGQSAKFKNPYSIVTDGEGNLYTTDENDPRIRKITPSGDVTTYAGTELPGFADGNADTARFGSGNSIAIDGDGNLYVADALNNRIRKVSVQGKVSTMGTDAQFALPGAIAIDKPGNIYVVDRGNFRIRKISPDGNISTVAGSGVQGFKDTIASEAQFSFDLHDIVVDSEGNLYVEDANRIRRISVQGMVSTIAGSTEGFADGEGVAAQFNFPAGMDIDSDNNIYVADLINNRIRKISFE